MAEVILDLSMSLDGFIAGPNDGGGRPLGEGGERLYGWMFGDEEVVDKPFTNVGAVVMGRRSFDSAEILWGDTPPFQAPCFVLTHHAREKLVKGVTEFIFVTDGIESVVERAKAAAGDKHVEVGGAATVQQCINAGLVDEIRIHLVPILLGGGIRLFENISVSSVELEKTRAIDSTGATHFSFRIVK